MTSKEKLKDIKYLINEFYSTEEDRNGLTASAKKSKKLFNKYCRDIQKDLEVLERIKKALVIKQKMPDFKISEDFSLEEMLNNTLIEYAYMLEEKARKTFTEWILDNIDFEIIKEWLKNKGEEK